MQDLQGLPTGEKGAGQGGRLPRITLFYLHGTYDAYNIQCCSGVVLVICLESTAMHMPVQRAAKHRVSASGRPLDSVQLRVSAQCAELHCLTPASCCNPLQTSMDATSLRNYFMASPLPLTNTYPSTRYLTHISGLQRARTTRSSSGNEDAHACTC